MTHPSGLGQRLALATEAGLELTGALFVFQPGAPQDLSGWPNAQVIHPFRPNFEAFEQAGFAVAPAAQGTCEAAIVCLPRAKAEAYALIAEAATRSSGVVVVDGAKNHGVDSILKAVRQRATLGGTISKAHGKLFWFAASDAFADWAEGPQLTTGGFWTAPGVFSADAVDEGSALLAEVLPDLKGEVADLGAGWGYLSAHILTHPEVRHAHLVEAHHMALQCAEHNVTDPRARFYWADVTKWVWPATMDTVVMNPPFHASRKADPGLGQTFIETARAMLAPKGRLFMVANRHLPYEAALEGAFRKVVDLGGNQRFKLLLAEHPRRR